MTTPWTLYGQPLDGRLLLGSAGYPSPQVLQQAIAAAAAPVVTVGLRRSLAGESPADNGFVAMVRASGARLLPNTAGCRTAREAVTLAHVARELYGTGWIKLEVCGDAHTLQPDPWALLDAATELRREGFAVFPYCSDDLVACRRLLDAGCEVLMPGAAPIGSGQGLLAAHALRILRERLPDVPLIVDAGLGAPHHAARVMEMGFDGVLVNSAVARAGDPVRMARAFSLAVEAGRMGHCAGLIAPQDMAVPSTPVAQGPVLIGRGS